MITAIAAFIAGLVTLLGFGTPTVAPSNIFGAGLNISTVATSTFPDGINITKGCFAKAGSCITLASFGGTLGVANGGTGATTLTGLLQGNGTGAITGSATINNGNWSGTDLSAANGGTGVSTLTGVALGNGTSAFTAASTQTCTNQFVRAMSASYVATCNSVTTSDFSGQLTTAKGGTGVDLSASTGVLVVNSGTASASTTLGVPRGGTGAATFGQGWIHSLGGTGVLAASTSPTVNYITATSTSATSTFAFGVRAAKLDLHTGTSTAANGFTIATGCYAIAGTCIGGGGGASKWLLKSYTTGSAGSLSVSSLNLDTDNDHYWIIFDATTAGTDENHKIQLRINSVSTANSYKAAWTSRRWDDAASSNSDSGNGESSDQWTLIGTAYRSAHGDIHLHLSKDAGSGNVRVVADWSTSGFSFSADVDNVGHFDGSGIQNTQTNVTSLNFLNDGTDTDITWKVWVFYPATS